MTLIDYIIIAIILISVLSSLARGFIHEALAIFVWVAAFWCGFKYANNFIPLLAPYVPVPNIRYPLAFFAIFIVVMIIGGLVVRILSSALSSFGLGGMDKVLGMAFGFVRGVLVVALLQLLLELTPLGNMINAKGSVLAPQFLPVKQWLRTLLPATPLNNNFTLTP